MIATGADIVDIDHLVPHMGDFISFMGKHQVFSGKSDPVSVIQDGSYDTIKQSVTDDIRETKGRCIVSAGCEITPGTTVENMKAFSRIAQESGE